MSTTTVKAIWAEGPRVEDLAEFRNSHGSAPVVWSAMVQRHLGLSRSAYMFESERLWPLSKDTSLPLHHRAVLQMTYDDAVIVRADFARAAKDIRAFLVDFPVNNEEVNHWPAIAELFESNPDCDAIGFHWTSVSEDPFEGPYDEENEVYLPPDLTQKWDSYRHLDRQSEASK